MSRTIGEMVREFHETYHLRISDVPTPVEEDERELRKRLMREEVDEHEEAMDSGDLAHLLKELSDVVYIAYGTAIVHGLDLDAGVAEVHRSNMTKLNIDGHPIFREDGKILKGPNYEEPDMERLLGR